MTRDIVYIVLGYFFGDILFARVFGQIFRHCDVTQDGDDRNPGTYNAFKYGGFWVGTLTLICDIAKGIIPVHMYLRGLEGEPGLALALVMAAPVVGHSFPILYRFSGGKGIAVTFGTLIGLFPHLLPGLFLAAAFIFFSVVVVISPHCYRTVAAFFAALVLIVLFADAPLSVIVGFLISSVCVNVRIYRSSEEKQCLEVRPAWKH